MIRQKGGVRLRVSGVFAAVGMAAAMLAGATPALADVGSGTALAASADAGGFARAARAANGNNGYVMSGAKYLVYRDSGCTQQVADAVLTVADDGGLTNTVELVAGTYYVKETTPDLTKGFTGYRVSNEVHTLTITPSQTTTISDATEPMLYGTFSFAKAIQETGSTQTMAGDTTSLAGFQYKVDFYTYCYDSIGQAQTATPDCTVTMQTDANGQITSANFANGSAITSGTWAYKVNGQNVVPCGTVVITETAAPKGFSVDSTPRGFVVRDSQWDSALGRNRAVNTDGSVQYVVLSSAPDITHTGVTAAQSNLSWRYGLKVAKMDADYQQSFNQGDGTLEGIKFRVKNASPNPVYIPQGTEGLLQGSGTVTVAGKTYVKFDPGADIIERTTEWCEDEGYYGFVIPDTVLQYGTYEVREITQSAKNTGNDSYLSSEWKKTFNYDNRNSENYVEYADADTDSAYAACMDPISRASIRVYKVDADTGESVAQGDGSLGNVTYYIVNKSDHDIMYNGKNYPNGAMISWAMTNAEGMAIFPDMPYGTYEIYESDEGNAGYQSNPLKVTIDTHATDQTVIDVSQKWEEHIRRGGLSVQKYDRTTGSTKPQGDGTFKGVVYGIYNASTNPVVVDGVTYDVGDEITSLRLTTDENGYAETAADALPYGTYYLKELQAPEGYDIDSTWRSPDIVVHDEGVIQSPTGLSEGNKDPVLTGGIDIQKYDSETGEPVAPGDLSFEGIQVTITNASKNPVRYKGQTYGAGQVVATVTLDKSGHGSVGDLPYGTYTLKETYVPAGAVGDPNWNPTVRIREGGETVYVNNTSDEPLENTSVKYEVRIWKVDSDGDLLPVDKTPQGDATLSGAYFTVTNASKAAVTVAGTTYQPGEKIGTYGPSDVQGLVDIAESSGFPVGTYDIVESTAPEGYVLNPTHYQLQVVPVSDK